MMNGRWLFLGAISLAFVASCDDLQPINGGGASGAIPIDESNDTQTVIRGETKELYGARVTTWVIVDKASGKLQTVKWTLPLASVYNVANLQQDFRYWIELPAQFRDQTVFDAMSYDYLPHGHSPAGLYNIPHWDFHFTTLPRDESAAIDCRDPTIPVDALLPKAPGAWFFVPPPDNCVPGMGIHGGSSAMAELNSHRFDKTMGMAYYHGKFASYEAKATDEYLKERKPFDIPVPRAPVKRAGLYPGSLKVTWDKPSDTFIWTLSDFTEAEVDTLP